VQLAQKLTSASATITDLISVLTPAIKGGGNDIDEKKVKELIGKSGLIQAMKCAGDIVTKALETGQDEGNEQAEEDNKE
jgi:hypothetical protein|tara:strand:+ start:725 stop:961 length:237 start_codon:yes stop_codon:yes gene_type:complete